MEVGIAILYLDLTWILNSVSALTSILEVKNNFKIAITQILFPGLISSFDGKYFEIWECSTQHNLVPQNCAPSSLTLFIWVWDFSEH